MVWCSLYICVWVVKLCNSNLIKVGGSVITVLKWLGFYVLYVIVASVVLAAIGMEAIK